MRDIDEIEIDEIDEDEIEERLKQLHIPFASEYFADGKTVPYCVYLTPEAEYYGADGYNMLRDQKFRIELYTLSKKAKQRKQLFDLFSDVPFSVIEISDNHGPRNYYLTVIEFEQTLQLDNDDDEE